MQHGDLKVLYAFYLFFLDALDFVRGGGGRRKAFGPACAAHTQRPSGLPDFSFWAL